MEESAEKQSVIEGQINSKQEHPFLNGKELSDFFKRFLSEPSLTDVGELVVTMSAFGANIWDDNFDYSAGLQAVQGKTLIIAEHLKEGEVKGTLLKEAMLNPMNFSGIVRLIGDKGASPVLFIARDKKDALANYFSRTFPIVGSQLANKLIQDQKLALDNPDHYNKFIDIIGSDFVFENLRNTTILVVGGGTVGQWIMDVASRLGIGDLGFFELPNETNSLHNIQRLPGRGVSSLGTLKKEEAIHNLIRNNPFSEVTYYGAFDPSKESQMANLELQIKAKRSEGKPVIVVMALDSFRYRILAHGFFKNLADLRVSPTDIGSASHNTIHSLGEEFIFNTNLPPHEAILEMLGGEERVFSEYDKPTVDAFMAYMREGAYGFFPQTVMSGMTTAAAFGAFLVMLAKGESVQGTSFVDPAKSISPRSSEVNF